jgi:hypothetical protein
MKKSIFTLLITFLVITFNVNAQPQWKFHMAFEDATAAKDTIWFIWDTTATIYGIDTLLGEGNPHMDYNVFNVWTLTGGAGAGSFDTTKVVAYPYYGQFGEVINAMNFVLPVKITWDSSLFHADWLPAEPVGWVNNAWISNDYFFSVNNTEGHYFDLTLDNHTIMPDSTIVGTEDEDPWFWLPERNFPLGIGLMQDPTLLVKDNLVEKSYFIYPNPVYSLLKVDTKQEISIIKIFNMQGKCLQVVKTGSFPLNIDFSGFNPGIYVIQLTSNQNQYYYEKIIKAN